MYIPLDLEHELLAVQILFLTIPNNRPRYFQKKYLVDRSKIGAARAKDLSTSDFCFLESEIYQTEYFLSLSSVTLKMSGKKENEQKNIKNERSSQRSVQKHLYFELSKLGAG